jgi:RNA recognition motif-containing protein
MASRIYVGKIGQETTEDRLREVFSEFGNVKHVELKAGFAFVFYDNPSEADRAIEKMHGGNMDGHILLVESSRDGRHKPMKRFDLRVLVDGLDPRVSWQDLKDWAREAGDVTFSNVFSREGRQLGVVEFKVRKLTQ